jgi:hypothetical protein
LVLGGTIQTGSNIMTLKDRITNFFHRKPTSERVLSENNPPKSKKNHPLDLNQIIIEVKNSPEQSDEVLTVGTAQNFDQLEDENLTFFKSDLGENGLAESKSQENNYFSPSLTKKNPDHFFDTEFLRIFEQSDVECLEEYCFLLTKYPQLSPFFEKIKNRVLAGQYIFDGPPPGQPSSSGSKVVPVLTVRVRLKDDQQNYELSSLKLAIGQHHLDDSSLYPSDLEQKKAIINIFSTFVSYTTNDYPAKALNLYDKLIFFKYIGYIISVYGQKDNDNSDIIRKLN